MKFVQALKEYKTRHSRSSSTVTLQKTEVISERDMPISRTSSSASIRSTSSKKLAWLLGADAIDATMERPIYGRSYSTPISSKLAFEEDNNWPLTSSSEDNLSDDESNVSETDTFKIEETSIPPITEIYDEKALLHDDLKQEEASAQIAPDSPDVDSLSVATFAPFTLSSSQCSTPRYQGNLDQLRSTSPEDAVDFNEVCERLLDTLSSSLTRPSLDQHQSGSSIASSKSSTKLFTEPASPSSFSSASSINSVAREEKMEKAKSALVADQAALDAKLKLAAARDALKRVRSNVATPQTDADITRPMPARSYTTQIRTHTRTSSENLAKQNLPTMPHSRSASSLTELSKDRTAPRSSRSSRMMRDGDLPILTQKSNVRIGIAAPKDLSVLKKGGDRTASGKKPAAPLKVKGKAALYVPQNHITSINEIMA